MGIHSVGTNPMGSTIPCFDDFRSELLRVDDSHGIAGHVRNVKPAAVAIDGKCHRLGAEVTLMRQTGIEVALDGELTCTNIHGGYGVAIGERYVQGFTVGRELECAGMSSRSDWAGRLEQGQLAAYSLLRQVELCDL